MSWTLKSLQSTVSRANPPLNSVVLCFFFFFSNWLGLSLFHVGQGNVVKKQSRHCFLSHHCVVVICMEEVVLGHEEENLSLSVSF